MPLKKHIFFTDYCTAPTYVQHLHLASTKHSTVHLSAFTIKLLFGSFNATQFYNVGTGCTSGNLPVLLLPFWLGRTGRSLKCMWAYVRETHIRRVLICLHVVEILFNTVFSTTYSIWLQTRWCIMFSHIYVFIDSPTMVSSPLIAFHLIVFFPVLYMNTK